MPDCRGQRSWARPDLIRDERGPARDEWDETPRAVAVGPPAREDGLMRLPSSPAVRLAAVWCGVAVFFSAENVLVGAARHRPFDWQWDVYHEFVYALTWAAFSSLVLAAGRRWPLGAGRAGRTLAPHLLVMAVLAPSPDRYHVYAALPGFTADRPTAARHDRYVSHRPQRRDSLGHPNGVSVLLAHPRDPGGIRLPADVPGTAGRRGGA